MDLFNYWWALAVLVDNNPLWLKGDYFDRVIMHDSDVPFKFIDKHGRKVIVVPLKEEYVVMNERFTNDNGKVKVINKYWKE